MSTTQPIRDKKSLQSFRNFYRDRKEHLRNYTIIVMGLNTALRINDILHLTYDMVYQNHKVRSHIVVKERKTGKENRILLNSETRHLLAKYRKELIKTTMYQEALNLGEHISCHSLRKTFGYHAWKQGANQVMLMTIFNHSSFAITRRYLCIDQDEKDSIFRTIYQNAA